MATAKKTKPKRAPSSAPPQPVASAPAASVVAVPAGVVALTREQVLGAKDIKEEWVEVPEWGGSILIRALSGVERDAFEKSIIVGKGADREVNVVNMRSKLVSQTARDHVDGQMLFAPTDIVALGQKSGAALQRVFEVAARLSGISKQDQKSLTENLDKTGGEGSPSDSPSPLVSPATSS